MASISPQSVPQQFISPFSVENIISKKETGLKGEETSLNHSGSSSASAASGYGKFFFVFLWTGPKFWSPNFHWFSTSVLVFRARNMSKVPWTNVFGPVR